MSSPSASRLNAEQPSLFAGLALGHVAREYPNKLDHVMAARRTCWGRAPCTRSSTAASTGTPACTATGCWPPCCAASRDSEADRDPRLFDQAFTAAKVAGEVAYLARPGAGLRAALRLGLAA
jgi:hypothetical protein